jgi:hypothetical protein
MSARVTNCLRLGWAPTLDYYENRTAFLRQIEASGEMHAFFVAENDAGARIGEHHHEIRVGARGAIALLFPPEDSSAARLTAETLATAFDSTPPSRVKSLAVFTQHLIGVEADYRDLTSGFASSTLGDAAGRIAAFDAALMADGSWSLGSVELAVGYVDSGEIEARLLGGAAHAHAPRDLMAARSMPNDLPDTAFYVEANWTVDLQDRQGSDLTGQELLEIWEVAAAEADELTKELAIQFGALGERTEVTG